MLNFELPQLPYAQDALAPHMSAETLEYHYGKHHQTYVDNANKLIASSSISADSLEDVVKASYKVEDGLFNNAAQHYNHCLFWDCMSPDGGGAMPDSLAFDISANFGSTEAFFEQFSNEGKAQFGSGWVWLALQDGTLRVMRTPNGENPLVYNATPILGCDVWEHSYYLDFRNDRGGYLNTFLNQLVNWDWVASRLQDNS